MVYRDQAFGKFSEKYGKKIVKKRMNIGNILGELDISTIKSPPAIPEPKIKKSKGLDLDENDDDIFARKMENITESDDFSLNEYIERKKNVPNDKMEFFRR